MRHAISAALILAYMWALVWFDTFVLPENWHGMSWANGLPGPPWWGFCMIVTQIIVSVGIGATLGHWAAKKP